MGKEVQQQIALNLLSEGTQITGDLHASNDIRIDGELKGKIFTKGYFRNHGREYRVDGDCFLEGKVGIHGNDQSCLYRDRVRSGF